MHAYLKEGEISEQRRKIPYILFFSWNKGGAVGMALKIDPLTNGCGFESGGASNTEPLGRDDSDL